MLLAKLERVEIVGLCEAARQLGVRPSTLRYWVLVGRVPALRRATGRGLLFHVAEIERLRRELAQERAER